MVISDRDDVGNSVLDFGTLVGEVCQSANDTTCHNLRMTDVGKTKLLI